jgi:predicted ATPase
LELRAAMSLARVWSGQGKRVQARERLCGVYSRFTEGFDTADLVQARGLISELAA